MPKADGTLKAREFVFFCEDQILNRLPAGFPAPERRVMWTTLQLHFGDERVHFELQPQMGRALIEAGLHFEGPVETNDAWVELLADHAGDILSELGLKWELEEWTASWRRLHRPFPFDRLSTDLAHAVAAEVTAAMVVLHPLLVEGLDSIGRAPSPAKGAARTNRRWKQRAR